MSKKKQQKAKMRDRIFIQIPGYRDTECQWTIKDALEKAKYPERIFIGVCWQLDPEHDQDCLLFPLDEKQVRSKWYHAQDSIGLGWARNEAQSLWAGEEYTLQIDSHMRFAKDWDEEMIAMLDRCPSSTPVISALPAGYTPPNNLDEKTAYHHILTAKEFKSSGGLLHGAVPVPEGTERPIMAAFVAGGYIFGPAKIMHDAPPDPYMFFAQEEINMAVRMWTHGWDIFSPDKILLYHYYNVTEESKKRPLHWADNTNWAEKDHISRERFDYLMGANPHASSAALTNIEGHSLGTARSIEDYYAFSDVNFSTKTIGERAKKGVFDTEVYKAFIKGFN